MSPKGAVPEQDDQNSRSRQGAYSEVGRRLRLNLPTGAHEVGQQSRTHDQEYRDHNSETRSSKKPAPDDASSPWTISLPYRTCDKRSDPVGEEDEDPEAHGEYGDGDSQGGERCSS